MPSSDKKLILVIGATGAQGIAVIKALLAPNSKTDAPSPFRIRALTRDVKNQWAKELETLGEVELFQGVCTLFLPVSRADRHAKETSTTSHLSRNLCKDVTERM